MWKFLSLLQKNLVWSIPIAMLAGLLFGYFFNATPLKQLIMPITFIMVYPMMVTLYVKSVFKGGDYKTQISAQALNFFVIPVLAFYMGKLFFSGAEQKFALWAVGLFLVGVMPTSGMTISWTGFAGGNKEAAIKIVLFGLLLGALAAPLYTKVFMGATIEVNVLYMFKQISLFVILPMGAGLITQWVGRKKWGEQDWNRKVKPKFPPFSALGVVFIAFVAMSLKANSIIAHPEDMIVILVPVILFYLISYLLLSLIGRLFFPREDAIAMVFGVVMRNLSDALAVAMTAFGQEGLTIALLISLAYVVQIQSAAWYVKLTDKIFGANPEKVFSPAKTDTSLPEMPDTRTAEKMVTDIRKILFATDLSDTARHAVKYACSIGHQYDAQVAMIHVVPDVLDEYTSGSGINLQSRAKQTQREQLNKQEIERATRTIRSRIEATSKKVLQEIPRCPLTAENIIVKAGDPIDEIVKEAENKNYDLIIMGTHGHGKWADMVIGSTADGVIRKTTKPVLVAKKESA